MPGPSAVPSVDTACVVARRVVQPNRSAPGRRTRRRSRRRVSFTPGGAGATASSGTARRTGLAFARPAWLSHCPCCAHSQSLMPRAVVGRPRRAGARRCHHLLAPLPPQVPSRTSSWARLWRPAPPQGRPSSPLRSCGACVATACCPMCCGPVSAAARLLVHVSPSNRALSLRSRCDTNGARVSGRVGCR